MYVSKTSKSCASHLLAPTPQLDVQSVKWLEDYLIAHDKVTVLTVSHDSGYELSFSIVSPVTDFYPQILRSALSRLATNHRSNVPHLDNVCQEIIHYESKKVSLASSRLSVVMDTHICVHSLFTTPAISRTLSSVCLRRTRTTPSPQHQSSYPSRRQEA